MEKINIELKIEKTIDVDVELDDIIWGINDLPIKKRWNHVAKIINAIQLDLSELTDGQKLLIKEFLIKNVMHYQMIPDLLLYQGT